MLRQGLGAALDGRRARVAPSRIAAASFAAPGGLPPPLGTQSPRRAVVLEGAIWSLDGPFASQSLAQRRRKNYEGSSTASHCSKRTPRDVCADALSQLEAKNGFSWDRWIADLTQPYKRGRRQLTREVQQRPDEDEHHQDQPSTTTAAAAAQDPIFSDNASYTSSAANPAAEHQPFARPIGPKGDFKSESRGDCV